MTRRWVIAMLLATALSLPGCDAISGASRFRFRVIVDVATPNGIKSGSSVWEYTARKVSRIGNGMPIQTSLRAEAVVVDIGERSLFLLVDEQLGRWALEGFIPFDGKPDYTLRTMATLSSSAWHGQTTDIDPQHYPLLVTFGDTRDPKSVERVDPAALDKSLGEGVMLRRITVAVIDDPVTTMIEKRLGWLSEVGRQRGTLIPNPPRLLKDATAIQLIGPSDFSTELYK